MKLLNDFKKFAFKGNAIDMAVGVIVGGAFGKIVTSIVNDLMMPLFGFVVGGVNLSSLRWVLVPASEGTKELAITYGAFFQTVVDFLIIATSIFLFVRIVGNFIRKKEEKSPPPKKDETVLLLEEIRDILKDK